MENELDEHDEKIEELKNEIRKLKKREKHIIKTAIIINIMEGSYQKPFLSNGPNQKKLVTPFCYRHR